MNNDHPQSQPANHCGLPIDDRRRLLTCREVAERLGFPLSSVHRMCREDRLPHIRFSARNYRIRLGDLEDWLNQHTR